MNKRLQRSIIVVVLIAVCLPALGLGNSARLVPLIDLPRISQYLPYLEKAIATANSAIDILLSDGELAGNPLWDEVTAAAARGVAVRVILDRSDWSESITDKNQPTIDYLTTHGIPARFDDPAVTTHAKLVVIDDHLAILGSSNWNEHAFTEQAQANITVDDPRIGEVFTEYFNRIWDNNLVPGGVRIPIDRIGNGPTLIPLPDGPETKNYARVLLKLVNGARSTIHVVMYRASYYPAYKESLANDILNALVAAAGRGVEVKVFLDDCTFYSESAQANREAAHYLADHGIAVRFDDPSATTHAKLVIIDGCDVVLGSTNWNYYSLERNNETDIAALGVPALAAAYERFFSYLWTRGRPVR